MKYFSILLVLVSAAFLFGCTSLPGNSGVEFNTYENQQDKVAFDKPVAWVQQPDANMIARFGDLQSASFAVGIVPNLKAADFDSFTATTYADFQQNAAFFNLAQRNVTLGGSSAVIITSDQRNVDAVSNQEIISVADLFIVKDVQNDRLLLVSFVTRRDSLSSTGEIKQRVLNSFKII
ncbi:MAG: hypothetical protein Q8R15_03110 [Candidatus Micrarchaeota archaeon]|nr:hypothetical protein [Candidatus Micrarchaeota archaeon]